MGVTSILLGILLGICPSLSLIVMVDNADLDQVAFFSEKELLFTLIAIVLFGAIGLISILFGILSLFFDKIPDKYLLRKNYFDPSN